jgi:hypothetical protein
MIVRQILSYSDTATESGQQHDWSPRLRHGGVLLIFAPHSPGSSTASLALLEELRKRTAISPYSAITMAARSAR